MGASNNPTRGRRRQRADQQRAPAAPGKSAAADKVVMRHSVSRRRPPGLGVSQSACVSRAGSPSSATMKSAPRPRPALPRRVVVVGPRATLHRPAACRSHRAVADARSSMAMGAVAQVHGRRRGRGRPGRRRQAQRHRRCHGDSLHAGRSQGPANAGRKTAPAPPSAPAAGRRQKRRGLSGRLARQGAMAAAGRPRALVPIEDRPLTDRRAGASADDRWPPPACAIRR